VNNTAFPAKVTKGDLAEVLALLSQHETQSMFLLVNLLGKGQPMDTWVWRSGGQVCGILGLTAGGMVLPQWPGGDMSSATDILQGRLIEGFIGPADQVHALRSALSLNAAPARHAGVEPGYRLDLGALQMPDSNGYSLRPIEDVASVAAWRAAYEVELFATPMDDARASAEATVLRWQAADSHRVLWHKGSPVALTGFNARLSEVAQVGGVFVPRDLRGAGHARRAVALHLAEARGEGLRRAVLFAVSAAAAHVYETLGFRPAGHMSIVLFRSAQTIAMSRPAEVPCS
jgi:GNAT superfamily N-acetyltransferase